MTVPSKKRSSFKANGELVENQLPVMNGTIPLLGDVLVCQPEALAHSLRRRERAFSLGGLA